MREVFCRKFPKVGDTVVLDCDDLYFRRTVREVDGARRNLLLSGLLMWSSWNDTWNGVRMQKVVLVKD